MEEFKVKDFTFRLKKMNAIDLLALRSQISFDSFENAQQLYNTILERVEVKVKDDWIQVKQGNNYYPASIEEDVDAIETIISEVMTYLKKVFQKSNASKTQTE